MTSNIFQTPQYRKIMKSNINDTIEYLFDKNKEFAVACEVKHITFTPNLPSEILNSFNKNVLFILSGFTFESAKLKDEHFSFEAGFGADNFGSVVSVPIFAIKQLFVDDNPIIINLVNHIDKREQIPSQKSSMETLLNNPKNKNIFKKKR